MRLSKERRRRKRREERKERDKEEVKSRSPLNRERDVCGSAHEKE